MTRASGTFEVKVVPQAAAEGADAAAPGRLLLDKQFHGDLELVSEGAGGRSPCSTAAR